MKFVLGISGASSVQLGMRFLENLPMDLQVFLVISKGARKVFEKEKISFELPSHIEVLDSLDIGACIASGSFGVDKMAIIPTSMNKLAKIACGIADDLITRSASVMLKEKKPLLLAPREIPFASIALENMLKLSNNGAIIAPPVLGYYAKVQNLCEMENFIVGRWLDLLDIKHNLYKRWGSDA